jgi:DNA processing protein
MPSDRADRADRAELAARLALLAVPRLEPARVIALIVAHGNARAACAALLRERDSVLADAARSEAVRERTKRALHAVESEGIQVIPFDDPRYPESLSVKLGVHRPPVLFAIGNLELLEMPTVGVVGCRHPSEYGLDIAEQIGDAVARAGGCVVSGLALGIDAAAHAAALAADGATIGVLGCGVDVYYPRRNLDLQRRIRLQGLLLSELLPGEPPRKHQFPYRNRIIAALSSVLVVVEAGEKSGALSTAEHAGNQGALVFAVPNAIDRPTMQGILRLYDDGVAPYTGLRTLLESAKLVGLGDAIPGDAETVEQRPAGVLPGRIWAQLGMQPQHVDSVASALGEPATDVLVTLLELELDGYVSQLSGARFVRRPAQPNKAVREHATATGARGMNES